MHDIIQKIKRWAETPEITTVAIIIFVGLASFGLGRLSALETLREPVRITASVAETVETAGHRMARSFDGIVGVSESAGSVRTTVNFDTGGKVLGSKNGTKYHFPWCSGAQRIKEENKRWFDSVAAARAAGYSPAGNCKGLE
ncbi:MAG: hypothetical protein Q8R39_03910 [bacterium]|nr:hypothetical protein [bacterium]MDZ4285262.1 hypothetical protein [Patescibacteria group bacterium]